MKLICKNIVDILTKKKIKISFAESCTGGLVSSAITSIKGSSKIFGLIAVTLASVNIFGGFLVTYRMLSMFKKKTKKEKE